MSGLSLAARAKKRILLAKGIVVSGMFVAGATAMILNGGLRAPAAPLILVGVAVVGWTYGQRGAQIAAMGATALVLGVSALGQAGMLRTAPPPPPLMHAVYFSMYIALMWIATAYPHRRLRLAVAERLEKEANLNAELQRRRRAEAAFRAVFEQSPRFLVLVDPEGAVLDANHAALDMLRVGKEDDLVGKPLLSAEAWSDDAKAALRDGLEACAKDASPTRFELPGWRETSVLEFTLTPILDEQDLHATLVEGRDLSDVIATREREARAMRLQLVGQLAGGVAHDFNNVLTAILSSAQFLEEDLRAEGKYSGGFIENVETITSMGHRAADLTKRLLTFARRAPLERLPHSMHELLGSTVKLLERTLGGTVQVIAELGATRDVVLADASSLETAFLNLAVNARDAMPRGGTLTISTSDLETDNGRAIRVSVRDTGAGIEPRFLPRIFEPFFSTKTEGRGTGLGLASVQATMEAHGASVHIESKVGEGTVFHMDFPLSDQERMSAARDSSAWPLPSMRALVVDDEPALQRLTPRLLSTLGIESDVAADCEAGLEIFKRAPSQYGLAVLDIVMPGRQGTELAADLLAYPDIKVLLVSGFPRDADVDALPKDRVRMLSKPFSSATLSAALRALFRAGSPH